MDLQLQDYRFVKNPFLMKPLKERAYRYYDDFIQKSFKIQFLNFIPVVNITDLQNVNIYLSLMPSDQIIATGSIVIHVHFPDVRTLDDLLNLFVLKENINFEIGEISSFFFKSKKEQLMKYIFMYTSIFQNASSYGDNIKPNDRMFNISTPKYKFEGIYMAYQREDHFDSAEIITFKNNTCQLLGKISLTESNKKSKLSIPFFSKNKNPKNRQNYEQLL